MDFQLDSKFLVIPRGVPGLKPFTIDMSAVYLAEGRLPETRFVNPHTAIELTSAFNEASGLIGKYISWINYEILQAEKEFGLCKATVILDKLPEQALKLKESGIKINEDYREAMIIRDADCSRALDILNGLKASKEFLESKHRLFERAYYSCRNLIAQPQQRHGSFNAFNGELAEPQQNFMGKNETKKSLADDDVIAAYRDFNKEQT
jgi:hypothetical protein